MDGIFIILGLLFITFMTEFSDRQERDEIRRSAKLKNDNISDLLSEDQNEGNKEGA